MAECVLCLHCNLICIFPLGEKSTIPPELLPPKPKET